MKKIVAIGGGSGLSTLLRGLRDYPIEITAIVTMTDNGSSSGRMRKDFKILPPGDIRKCIAALSEEEGLLLDLFEYRFRNGLGLNGHSIGNLLISGLKDILGSFEAAIEEISKILKIKGTVLPASLEDVHLKAIFNDSRKIIGESEITKYGYNHIIKKLQLTKSVDVNPRVKKAISEADLILVGPGSLYTSILPNFLINDLKREFKKSKALKVFISNNSTERGETENFTLADHIKVLKDYGVDFDVFLVNSKEFPSGSGDGFISPVKIDIENVLTADLLNEENFLYHDSSKLGSEIWKIILKLNKLKGQNFIKK